MAARVRNNELDQIRAIFANYPKKTQTAAANFFTLLSGGAPEIAEDDEIVATPRRERKAGRPKKNVEDVQMSTKRGPGRPPKSEKSSGKNSAKSGKAAKAEKASGKNTAAKPAAAKKPAKPAADSRIAGFDFSDMGKSDLTEAATTLGISGKILKSNNLKPTLMKLQKLATTKDIAAIEKLAKKADVELTFGRGRPPAHDEDKNARVLAKMVSEGVSI